MVDINKALLSVSRTGRITFGAKRTTTLLKLRKVKLIVVASNCPRVVSEELESNARIANVPIHKYTGTSINLGEACRKPFPVSVLGVREPGDSDILSAVGITSVE